MRRFWVLFAFLFSGFTGHFFGVQADTPSRDGQPGGHYLDVDAFPTERMISGGVGKDGIPALTDPVFVDANHPDAGYIKEDDLVLGVVIQGDARAYPHNIGWWHEIVNDVVGGQPIVVSFCPLTGTGMVFHGQDEDGSRILVGVSGLLFNNNLVMYDRRDNRTLYPQMIFRGVSGPRRGAELELLPVVETTWRFWKQMYPGTRVIGGQTGVYQAQQYEFYPYTRGSDYREDDRYLLFDSFPAPDDNPAWKFYGAKQKTMGVRFGELAIAYPFSEMAPEAVVNDSVAGQEILVVFYAQENLAIPYFRTVGGRTFTFVRVASLDTEQPFLMEDRETGSVWNLKGEALRGPLAGTTLTQVPAHNAFWFAWATFWQNTGVATSFNQGLGDRSIDFNADGRVDFSDFLEFVRAFGTRKGEVSFDTRFDLDGSGEVSLADFLVFVRLFQG